MFRKILFIAISVSFVMLFESCATTHQQRARKNTRKAYKHHRQNDDCNCKK